MLNHLPSLARPPALEALEFENPGRSWPDAVAEIRDVMALEDNWDGAGAGRMEGGLAAVWPVVLSQLQDNGWAPPTYVRPTPDGCLSLEWELSDGNHLEAELSPTEIHWILTTPQGVEVETEPL